MIQENNLKNRKVYYQVIPLVRLSLVKSNEFTYHFWEKIPFGSVIKIKLNNKIIRGIVLDEFKSKQSTSPPFKTSPILEIITPAQLIKKQIRVAKLITKYYLTPLSTTLKFFAFKLTKKNNSRYFKNLQEQLKQMEENKWQKKIILTISQKKAIEKIKKNNKLKSLLFGPPASGKTEIVVEVIKKILNQNKQTLVLIPEIFLSYQEIIRYGSKFISQPNEKIAILHSKLKPSEITTIWNEVKSGKIKIIISTRMGVFLPFKNLGLIIIDEEQDISHKQWDTPPFYHTQRIAEFLQTIHKKNNPKVLLVASTPSLNNFYKAKINKDWQIIKLASLQTTKIKVNPPQIELIDLKKYYKKGEQILISNELRWALKNSLDKNKIGMILVPRRGKSHTIICQDCHETPTCPDCQVPLTHGGNYYRCLHCGFKISNISKCPHCGSFRLADIGFGTESVQDLIQTMFPSAKTAIADGTTFADNSYRQKILNSLYNNKLDFLIGTYAIAKGLDIDAVNLVAILNADNWPGQTDFRFDENYLSTIFQLAGRVNRPGGTQDGKCLIQTFDPTNRIFIYLKEWNWQAFLKYELENRKALQYPPFRHLLKITYRNYHREVVEKELDKFQKKLSVLLINNVPNVTAPNFQLLPPYYGYQEKLRSQFQKHLLIKIAQLPITNKKFLKILDLPTGWKIDVDTENIF
jgi:primosomal protein N' (replication factor Y)